MAIERRIMLKYFHCQELEIIQMLKITKFFNISIFLHFFDNISKNEWRIKNETLCLVPSMLNTYQRWQLQNWNWNWNFLFECFNKCKVKRKVVFFQSLLVCSHIFPFRLIYLCFDWGKFPQWVVKSVFDIC